MIKGELNADEQVIMEETFQILLLLVKVCVYTSFIMLLFSTIPLYMRLGGF